MSKRRSAKSQPSRSILSELKRRGLYTGTIKRGKLSSYQYAVARKFRDIASGNFAAVKVGKDAKKFGELVAHGRVLVPVRPGEKPRYNAKRKIIKSTRNEGGRTVERVVAGMAASERDVPKQGDNGKRYVYNIGSLRTGSREEVIRKMAEYGKKFKSGSAYHLLSYESYWE